MRDFNHTVNTLVVSYLSGTLERGTCKSCAVTNIVGISHWKVRFVTLDGVQRFNYEWDVKNGNNIWGIKTLEEARKIADELIKQSGYTCEELAKIEFAFETASEIGDKELNGLMAVVDVLAEIHGIDLTEKESAKALFVKA